MNPRYIADMCTEEAIEQGCTCSVPFASSYDIDPPEPRMDRYCPLHGNQTDPDDARDRQIDDDLMRAND